MDLLNKSMRVIQFMKSKLQVLDHEINTDTVRDIEYICITDIARYKNS